MTCVGAESSHRDIGVGHSLCLQLQLCITASSKQQHTTSTSSKNMQRTEGLRQSAAHLITVVAAAAAGC